MISNTSLSAYRSHELTISMKTSSGDTLSLNFENTQELSLSQKQTDTSKERSFSFRSLQAFSFNLQSNGISEQDQKEIDTFLKKAQPYINKFMKELEKNSQTTPLNKIASDIVSMIGNLKERSDDVKNIAKNGVADLFDTAAKNLKATEKMVDEAQKLMQKIIDGFEKSFQPLYA